MRVEQKYDQRRYQLILTSTSLKFSSYIVDTLHGVPLEMTEDEKEQFRIQVISNQYAERLLSEAEKDRNV